MEQPRRTSREYLFPAIGVALLLLAIGYTVLALRLLARGAAALTREPAPPAGAEARFRLDELEPLIESGKLDRIPPP